MNNPLLFNAALIGAAGGCQERWLTQFVPGNFTDAIQAFATAVDNAIATQYVDPSIASLLESLCRGITSSRLLSSRKTADYAIIASTIAMMFNTVKVQMAAPILVQLINFNGQTTVVFQLQPVGHTAGLYNVTAPIMVRNGSAGIIQRTVEWTDPQAGPQSLQRLDDIHVADPGITADEIFSIVSSGTAPINVRFVCLGIDPSALLDLYGSASFSA